MQCTTATTREDCRCVDMFADSCLVGVAIARYYVMLWLDAESEAWMSINQSFISHNNMR